MSHEKLSQASLTTQFLAEQYVVIGNPIAHSKSPMIHRLFAAQTGLDIDYRALLLAEDGFAQGVQKFIADKGEGGRGANVTMPFKLEAYAIATQLSDRAKAAGAVNTLSFKGGDIVGDNTDGAGLVNDIENNAGILFLRKRVLLLGAGGAARGVILPILNAQAASLTIANRTVEKAQDLLNIAHMFKHDPNLDLKNAEAQLTACGFDQIQDQFDIVINATAASMSNAVPPISAQVFAAGSLAYDMMYSSAMTQDSLTPFLQFAQPFVAQTRDGLGMLVEQAAESFYVWHGVRPDTQVVLEQLRHQLGVSML